MTVEQRQSERNKDFTTAVDSGKLNIVDIKPDPTIYAMARCNVSESELFCQWASTEAKPLEL